LTAGSGAGTIGRDSRTGGGAGGAK
jgi:hypothetical protein